MGFTRHFPLLFFTSLFINFDVSFQASINPFSPRASLARFWNRVFQSDQIPEIMLSKSSPLNASQVAVFSTYIDSHTLPDHILSFCSAANLFCAASKSIENETNDFTGDVDFENYINKQFKKYQKDSVFGSDAFKNYSVGENVAKDTFLRYGQGGTGSNEGFQNYALTTNVAGSGFTNYASESNAESLDFSSYGVQSDVQGHDFTKYGSDSSANTQQFTSYSENSNVVKNGFTSYGSNANAMGNTFTGYSTKSNIVKNQFASYEEAGNGAIDQFSNYAASTNIARNDFRSYDNDANAGIEQFNNYGGDGASQPENVFHTYGKETNAPLEIFRNYGNSTNPAKNEFVEYGKDAGGDPQSDFTTYIGNQTTFKDYFRSKKTFSDYINSTGTGKNKSSVEPGKFFRQDNLVEGKLIPMPDIRDKMPRRSFLPRVLADKLPFSSARLAELIGILAAKDLEAAMARTISECERPAVKDETKRCVTSAEGMAEFAVSVIGEKAAVSTTASTAGYRKMLVVGKVVGRNGSKVTKSLSCHQSLFPYLVYYCHAVPRVKVYDVDLMDQGGNKVNQGVAICHLDTTQWSATHAAFVALGPGPGKIEVCHWIFENDLIWVAHD